MTEKRLLAVLGFLLALIGGILLLADALSGVGGNTTLEALARRAVGAILGIAAILGGLFIYKGRMSTGGLLTILIGVIAFILGAGGSILEPLLIIIGGVLGIVGSEARTTQ
ncbi:MAG: hypothetical protein E6K17_03945 [Methanobacteriota archaeon]|nr:MAG: hypothetical protein E6K17_03945 [Euryarchaeota archaeon]